MRAKTDHEDLRTENAELKARLEEAQETLRAIRKGEVDAVVIDSSEGSQLYTLESAAAASNRFRGEMLAQVEDVVIAVDLEERLTFLNVAAERLYGLSSAEALGHNLSVLRENQWSQPHGEQEARNALRTKGSWRGENIQVKRNGQVIHVESTVSCLVDADGVPTGFLAVIRETTERKKNEAAVRESAERIRFMAESMPQKIFTATPAGVVDYFNRQWSNFRGLTLAQIEHWEWSHFVHPDHLDETNRRWRNSIDSGDYFQLEHLFRRHDGKFHWHLTRAHAMRDSGGKILLWVGSSTDIEDQKQNAVKLEAVVAERTKDLRATNEQLEAFVYSIAHDLRGPLRTITGYSQFLVEEHTAAFNPEAQRLLNRIQSSAEFLDKLLLDLLAFGRTARTDIELSATDVGKAWEAAVFQCRSDIDRRGARIEVVGPLTFVRAHEATLGQCLANLLTNALKFSRPGVPPHIVFRCQPLVATTRLWVEDDGIGIAPEQHERIFRVFERLNGNKFPGTGIGLSIVRKGVERMNGRVGVESDVGAGTRFWLELGKSAEQ